MTFHSKAATNDIYDMFNQPLTTPERDDTPSGDETDYGEDTYSTAGESTGTGRISATTSEFGDDTLASVAAGRGVAVEEPTNVSPWSDFTASKHVPKLDLKEKSRTQHKRSSSEDMTENFDTSQDQTQTGGFGAFDTQAIAAIANQDFDDMDTKAIARIAGDVDMDTKALARLAGGVEEEEDQDEQQQYFVQDEQAEELKTPIEPEFPEEVEIHHQPRYVPVPPEDYEPTPHRPYRDPAEIAQNKLPFMTPIVEQTESSIASTVFKKADYFNAKTPSRTAHHKDVKYDSPSKLGIGNLLMSSPQKESPSPNKRQLSHAAAEEELLTSSPRKKVAQTPPQDKEEDLLELQKITPLPVAPAVKSVVPKPDDIIFKTPAMLCDAGACSMPANARDALFNTV